MRIRFTLSILYIVCLLPVIADDSIKHGLYFHALEVESDQRTSLNLTPDKALNLGRGFLMNFDLNLRREHYNFGYVFRLICNDTVNIDLLSDVVNHEKKFSLIVRNKTIFNFRDDEINFKPENWNKISISYHPSKDELKLTINGITKTVQCQLGKPRQVHVYFGGNMHHIFSTTEVAPMTVRNIRIFDNSARLVRYWKLDAHAQHAVYDECKQAKAVVSNPQWEIDKQFHWNRLLTLALPDANYSTAFDHVHDRIFIVKEKSIFVYHTKSQTLDTLKVQRGIPLNTNVNQLAYHTVNDELISYHFRLNRLATFNFHSLEWDNEDETPLPSLFWHHGKCYLPDDSLLVTFGGYGFNRYNSLLYQHHGANGNWLSTDLSTTIAPRNLGAMGYMGAQKLLYFGGYGSESGLQEESPRNYYDLYVIDFGSLNVTKIWELPFPKEHFTNSNSLAIDKNKGKFYALAFPDKRSASVVKLHEYDIDKPNYRIVGDSLPFSFTAMNSYCDLFQSADSSELYAVTLCYDRKENHSFFHIYSIAFPPLSQEEVIQHLPKRLHLWRRVVFILSLALFILMTGIFVARRKRKTVRTVAGSDNVNQINQIVENNKDPIVYAHLWAEKIPSSIHLLGNFQVVDSYGNDITEEFTPHTTQLFLLILLSTIKNGKGITSTELKNIMWYDKDDNSARNSRNVRVNKLRAILKTFGEIKIITKGDYLTIQYEKPVFCDYEKAMILMKTLQAEDKFNKKLLTELVNIALRGILLPTIQQTEWLDPYQTAYADRLIECLMRYSQHNELKTDLMLALKIADVILLHDNIDEDAIKLKCYALFHLGRKNQALQTFKKFTGDYKSLLNVKHNLLFEDLVKKNTD